MSKSKHDQVAENLAKKFRTKYKFNKGIDIVTNDKVIEVEVKESTLNQGLNQIIRSIKSRYLSVTPNVLKKALEITRGKGVGVMSQSGKIVKRARHLSN